MIELPLSKFRVNQLDALSLDDEITRIFAEWMSALVALVDGRLRLEWQEGIGVAAKVVGRYLPLLADGGSFGMAIQGMGYKASTALKAVYILLDLVLPLVSDQRWGRLKAVGDLARLLNFAVFIASGSYPTLLHRVLGLRMVPAAAEPAGGAVDFDYMNRQLLWQALTEFSLTVVPLVRSGVAPGGPLHRAAQLAYSYIQPRRLAKRHASGCGVCGHQRPAMPVTMSKCSHMFCYYCIATWRLANPHSSCPLCGP